jgi:hypothetical protein
MEKMEGKTREIAEGGDQIKHIILSDLHRFFRNSDYFLMM